MAQNRKGHSGSSAGPDSLLSTSSTIPANMLRRHPASLIPRHLHNPVLLGLLKAPVNDELIEYVAESTLAVVAPPTEPAQLPTPPTTPIKSGFRRTLSRTIKGSVISETKDIPETQESTSAFSVPSLTTFIKLTASRANAQAPTLLVTLVYLDRLRRRLKGAKAAKGMQCTYHRLFLACLIAAAKYCNDCCPRNVHWVKWSGLFTLDEVNLMEQELLMLLDYDLRVEETALIMMCGPFLPAFSAEKTSTMGRNLSCATARTLSADSHEDISTPPASPVAIRLGPVPAQANGDTGPKKLKLSDIANNPSVTVLTRAKSWYGNLRGSAS